MIPLAVVGATFRSTGSQTRHSLAHLDAERTLSQELMSSGAAQAVVCLNTCSRVEWIVSSSKPAWAGELLRSQLASHLELKGSALHLRTGQAALEYLFRVASGLESVAQGEHAVGKQMLEAFEIENQARRLDVNLKKIWKSVGLLLGALRREDSQGAAVGVQSLVVRALDREGVSCDDSILVFGQGAIGRAVKRALERKNFSAVRVYRRDTLKSFVNAAPSARAVVVCTGAHSAWLSLSPSAGSQLVIDVGSPSQVLECPNWTHVALDELLSAQSLLLSPVALERFNAVIEGHVFSTAQLLRDDSSPEVLSELDALRKQFVYHTLPTILEGLPSAYSKKVSRAVSHFAHDMLRAARASESKGIP
jgi:glutamyl-tRNA reductase